MQTKERLAQRLASLGAVGLAKVARGGLYSDFESPVAAPKLLLVHDLLGLELKEMAREVMDGKWGDTREEAEAWAAEQTGEVREMLDRLGKS